MAEHLTLTQVEMDRNHHPQPFIKIKGVNFYVNQ